MTTSAGASRVRPLTLLNAQYLPSSVDWRTDEGRRLSPFSPDTFIEAAQRAEAAGISALFQADFSGVNRASIRQGPPINAFEPFQLAALVARETSEIAVMPTVSTLYTHPFSFARGLASLDRIAEGRAWVNVVSSFRSGTAIGMKREVPRDRRHAQTEELLAVARKLWASWPPAATVPDPDSGRFVRDELISDVEHEGEFFEQLGPIDMAPYSAAFPFTLQATGSLAGLGLAARTADAVFAGTPTLAAAKALRGVLREETVRAGRPAGAVKLLPGAFIHIVDGPYAADRVRAHRSLRDRAGLGAGAVSRLRVEVLRARLIAAFPGLAPVRDLDPAAAVPADLVGEQPAGVLESLGSRYLPFWGLAQEGIDVGAFVEEALNLGEHAQFVGTAEQIGDELRRWFDEGGVDGFQFILGNDFDALLERVVPRVLGE